MIPDSQPNMIDLSAGSIDYIDTGGDGPTVVLLHGVLMNHTVWSDVITELVPAFRCIAPTLPLGAHREPMRVGADLSIDGIALLVAELLERLDLHDVTLIMNDWGGPQLLVDHDRIERISRLVYIGGLRGPSTTSRREPPVVGSPSSRLRPAGLDCRACCSARRRYAVPLRQRWPSVPYRMSCCATGSHLSSAISAYARTCAATASACRWTAAGIGPQDWCPSTSRPWWSGRRKIK